MSTKNPTILFGATTPETIRHFVADQAAFLSQHGFDVHVVCSDVTEFSRQESATLHYHSVDMQREPSLSRDLNALVAWIRLLRRVRPDVVMSGTPKSGLLALLAARIVQTPRRIYLMRGLRLEGLAGRSRVISLWTEKLTCRSATEVLCVSASLARRVAALGLTDNIDVTVLGMGGSNGVDTNHFRPPTNHERENARSRWGIRPGILAFGFAGRLTADKGILGLVDAFEEYSLDSASALLVLAGDLDAARPLDQNTLDALNSTRYLRLGHITDMRALYWALDVFCLPSIREGMPNVNLEAAACGLPVITTDATGCQDSVLDGVTGCMCPAGSSGSIYDAFVRLADHEIRQAYGEAGRVWVTENFSHQTVWGNLLAFLRPGG